ncbi:hypothetical protein [Paraburkholderia tropica]|uniref:hypothetical protein n=1 Tax=Paraburkholderia tropica TaxID=92647 RepID=UPI002AAF8665|nr:hypothetical protein [Paraburkholderia tropica]
MATYKMDKDGNATTDLPISGVAFDALQMVECSVEQAEGTRTITAKFTPKGTATVTINLSTGNYNLNAKECSTTMRDEADGKSVKVTVGPQKA